MDAGEKYLAHMGKYQVISLSLKSMKQYSYELSYNMLQKAVEGEYSRHWPLIENSKKLTDVQMERYLRIRDLKGTENDYADSSRDNFHPRHFSLYRLSLLSEPTRGLKTFSRPIYYSHGRKRTTFPRSIYIPHDRERATSQGSCLPVTIIIRITSKYVKYFPVLSFH